MAFPKPTAMSFSYPKQWSAEESGPWGALVDGNWIGTAETLGAQFAQRVATDEMYAAGSSSQGLAVNKRNRVIFQDLPFREVSLSWILSPRNRGQAASFIGAINALKIISAPILQGDQTLWHVEDCTFELTIKSSSLTLFQSSALVIKDIKINYTPHGFWSQHVDGFPTQIQLDIDLMETELLHRAKFGAGYW